MEENDFAGRIIAKILIITGILIPVIMGAIVLFMIF